ncbi:MAG: RICIN domain-containing protein [Parasporobacterium sp.]|nr:RICIN domain-containing protein [Parasporobacterium sp.]
MKSYNNILKTICKYLISAVSASVLLLLLTGCSLQKTAISLKSYFAKEAGIQEETAPISQEDLLVSSPVLDSQGNPLKQESGEIVTVLGLRELAEGGEPKINSRGMLETYPLGEPITYVPGSVVVNDSGQTETYQGGEPVTDILGFSVTDSDGEPVTRKQGEIVTHGPEDIVYSPDGSIVRYQGEYETYREGDQKYNSDGEQVTYPVAIQTDLQNEPMTDEHGGYVLGTIEIMTDDSGEPFLEENGELATKQLEPAMPEKKIPQVLEGGMYYIGSDLSAYLYLAPASEDPADRKDDPEIGLLPVGNDLTCFELRIDLEGYAIILPEGSEMALAAQGLSGSDPRVVLEPAEKMPYAQYKYWEDPVYTVSDRQKWIIREEDDGVISIASYADPQYVMTLEYSEELSDARLCLREYEGGQSQRFRAQDRPVIPKYLEEGDYYIRSGMTDHMLLSLGDDNYDDEREAYIYLSDQGEGQRFHITYDDYGYAIIAHGDSDKVLSVCGNYAADGQPVIQYEKDGDSWQRWILEPNLSGDNSFYIRSAMDPSKVISLEYEVAKNSTPVILDENDGTNTQYWFLEKETIPYGDEYNMMEEYARQFTSNTDYLIMISSSINHVGVYQMEEGRWENLFYWDCVTGGWATPTVKGEFILYDKLPFFDGNLDSPEWYTVYYANNFYPDYYIHSTIYHQGTMDIMDASIGYNGSHGCVRLYIENSEWIYYNVPLGTKVVSY